MIFLWLGMMLFLCVLGAIVYFFIKRPISTFGNFGKMGGYISTQFSRAKQAEIFQSFKSLKNKQSTLQKCAVLQGEEKEIFMLLRQGLPLGQVCILPHVSLRLFVESDNCPELEYCVSFLIAGNKSLLPLVAVDYLDELDEGARAVRKQEAAFAASKCSLSFARAAEISQRRFARASTAARMAHYISLFKIQDR